MAATHLGEPKCSLSLSLSRKATLIGVAAALGAALAGPALAQTVVYERDSIGPDSSATDFTDGGSTDFWPDVFYSVVTFEVPPGYAGEIAQLDVVAGHVYGSCFLGSQCYGGMTFWLRGWNSHAEVEANPLQGSLFDLSLGISFALVHPYGVSQHGTTLHPTSLLQFSTGGLGAMCPETGCVFGLTADISQTSDQLVLRRSSLGGYNDLQYATGCNPACGYDWAAGVRFTIVSAIPPDVCANSLDDDSDGLVDLADPGCADAADLSEDDPTLPCDDGADNDADGLTDFPADPACQTPTFTRENAKCQNGLDDDGDTYLDFDGGASLNGGVPAGSPDPQCGGIAWRDRETPAGGCGLGAEIALGGALLSVARSRSRRR